MNNILENTCKGITRKGNSCKNHPMKNSDYCYIHSFGKFKGIPWYKNSTFHLIIPVILTIALFLIGPSRNNQEKMLKNDEKTHDKLDEIDNKISDVIEGENYKPIEESLRLQIQHSLKSMNNKNLIISIRITQRSKNKELIGQELETLLKSGGFENAKYSGEFQLFSRNKYPPILISCHTNNINFVKELSNTLNVFLNTQFGIKPETGIPENRIQIAILSEPFFNKDGSVIFKN